VKAANSVELLMNVHQDLPESKDPPGPLVYKQAEINPVLKHMVTKLDEWLKAPFIQDKEVKFGEFRLTC